MTGKAIALRVLLAALGACVALALIAGAAFGLLIWRVNQGPLQANAVKPLVERALADAFAGAGAVTVETVTFSKDHEADLLILDIGGFDLETADGAHAGFRSLQLGFDARDLFAIRFGPQSIFVSDAAIRIIRREDAALQLDYGAPADGPANVFQNLTGGPYFRSAFERADVVGAQVSFLDEATGRAWTANGAALAIKRTSVGYAASLSGAFKTDLDEADEEAALTLNAEYDLVADLISANLSVHDAPVGDILSVYLGAPESIVTGLVSGEGAVTLTSGGRVLTSFLDATAVGGRLNIGALSTPVERIALEMNFDADNNEFLINTLDLKSADVSTRIDGVLAATPAADGPGYDAVSFGVNAAALAIAGGGAFENDVVIDRIELSGAYDVKGRRGHFNDILISLYEATATGELTFATFPDDSPEIKGELALDTPLTKAEVLSVWPVKAAFAARRFVTNRVADAEFHDIKAHLDLEAGAVNGGAIMPEEAMALTFRAVNAEVAYAPSMTPIKGLSGAGVLAGNSFTLDAERGRVGDVRLTKGKVSIPKLRPKGHPATFTFDATGDAGDILAILDEPPLFVLKETAFNAEDFRGTGTVSATIIRPNQNEAPRDSYKYEARAAFADLTVHDFYQDTPLTNASAEIALKTGEMTVTGAAELSGSPTTFNWTQRFSGDKDRTLINIDGRIDSSLGDLFGLPVRQFLRGAPPFNATAKGDLSAIRSVQLEADFTDVLLVSEALSWRKPKGAKASGGLELAFGDGGLQRLVVDIAGDGLVIDGALNVDGDGALTNLTFERLYLNGLIDMAIDATRADGVLRLNAMGPSLTLAGAIDQFARQSSGEGPGLATLLAETTGTIRVDQVGLKSGVVLHDAALDFAHGAERLSAFSFSATPNGAGALAASLETTDGVAPEQRIIAQTDDLGALFAGVLGVRSVRGGEGRIVFSMDAPLPAHVDPLSLESGPDEIGMETVAPASGSLTAKNIRVVGAPLLARVFSAGSLTGLGDLLSGEGIEIADATAGFSVEDGKIALYNARATGPSVGISAQGEFSLGAEGEIAVSGAVAPAYQLNSFLGAAPIIGDLLVNRDGEGVVAISYALSGRPQNPVIAVNPLSAFTPGVLRRVFEADELAETGGVDAAGTDENAPGDANATGGANAAITPADGIVEETVDESANKAGAVDAVENVSEAAPGGESAAETP